MIAQNNPKDRLLASVEPGQTVRLARIDAGPRLASRLAAMGLLPRAEVTMVRNGHPGPCVIGVRDSKVVLGRGMAERIRVY